jgi:hypothetical protein
MLATISLFLLPKFRQKRNLKNQKFENEMFLKRFSLQKREIKFKKNGQISIFGFQCVAIYIRI